MEKDPKCFKIFSVCFYLRRPGRLVKLFKKRQFVPLKFYRGRCHLLFKQRVQELPVLCTQILLNDLCELCLVSSHHLPDDLGEAEIAGNLDAISKKNIEDLVKDMLRFQLGTNHNGNLFFNEVLGRFVKLPDAAEIKNPRLMILVNVFLIPREVNCRRGKPKPLRDIRNILCMKLPVEKLVAASEIAIGREEANFGGWGAKHFRLFECRAGKGKPTLAFFAREYRRAVKDLPFLGAQNSDNRHTTGVLQN